MLNKAPLLQLLVVTSTDTPTTDEITAITQRKLCRYGPCEWPFLLATPDVRAHDKYLDIVHEHVRWYNARLRKCDTTGIDDEAPIPPYLELTLVTYNFVTITCFHPDHEGLT